MVKPLVLYHANCLDGFGAAYAAWCAFQGDADYVPVNYGEPPPDVTGRDVYVLDFSYPRVVLEEMHEKAGTLFVIDHHKTAQEDLAGLPYALFDTTHSGCVLAWHEFCPSGDGAPSLLRHIEDRDLWKFGMDGTREVCEALRNLYPMDFGVWYELTYKVGQLKAEGAVLLKAFEKDVEELLKRSHPESLADPLNLDGDGSPRYTTGLACNAPPKYASELGHRLAQQSGTFGMVYSYHGERKVWDCSLRSVGGFDVSAIAKFYGGGGHRNAAGFVVDNMEDL